MATLSTVRANIADMLRGRTDLNTQIDQEIRNAIEHYSRRCSWVLERRGGSITTVSGTAWYSQIDNTAGHGVEDSPSGTTPTATDDLRNLVDLLYAKVEQGTIDWPLGVLDYKTWESYAESQATSTIPRYLTHYAGKIGLWPTPDDAYTIYLSGWFKPSLPSEDSDESVWIAQYRELIENAAAGRVAGKWLHDAELERRYKVLAAEQESLLLAEGTARTSTGRLQATRF